MITSITLMEIWVLAELNSAFKGAGVPCVKIFGLIMKHQWHVIRWGSLDMVCIVLCTYLG